METQDPPGRRSTLGGRAPRPTRTRHGVPKSGGASSGLPQVQLPWTPVTNCIVTSLSRTTPWPETGPTQGPGRGYTGVGYEGGNVGDGSLTRGRRHPLLSWTRPRTVFSPKRRPVGVDTAFTSPAPLPLLPFIRLQGGDTFAETWETGGSLRVHTPVSLFRPERNGNTSVPDSDLVPSHSPSPPGETRREGPGLG